VSVAIDSTKPSSSSGRTATTVSSAGKGRRSVANRGTDVRLPGNSIDGLARKLLDRAFGDPLRMTERVLFLGEPVEYALPYRHHDLDGFGLPDMRAQTSSACSTVPAAEKDFASESRCRTKGGIVLVGGRLVLTYNANDPSTPPATLFEAGPREGLRDHLVIVHAACASGGVPPRRYPVPGVRGGFKSRLFVFPARFYERATAHG
jgi:hypothetical protein